MPKTALAALKRRYYVGTDNALVTFEQAGAWPRLMKDTLDDAIEGAREKLAKDNRIDAVPIVKVVAVVRREKLPVIVEKAVDA